MRLPASSMRMRSIFWFWRGVEPAGSRCDRGLRPGRPAAGSRSEQERQAVGRMAAIVGRRCSGPAACAAGTMPAHERDGPSPPTPNPRSLLLVDGSSYLYRAFHAMPDLRAVPGDPASPATGAIRGMINMMQKLRKRRARRLRGLRVRRARARPSATSSIPSTRPPARRCRDDLRAQIEPIHEVVRLLGWKVLNVPGVEADDVIGTLACMATERGHARPSSPAATRTCRSW